MHGPSVWHRETVFGGLDDPDDHDHVDRNDEQIGRCGEPQAGLRAPRTLPATSTTSTPTPIQTVAEVSDGIAEVTAATPAESETATVST